MATRVGNQLTEQEYSLLPNTLNFSDYFFAYSDASLYFDDSEEIIEPPIYREVMAYFDEKKAEIKKFEEALDNIN
jgi:hypothetical protein